MVILLCEGSWAITFVAIYQRDVSHAHSELQGIILLGCSPFF